MTKGQRIKNKRECLGISQTELAKKIGVSKQTLYKYENDLITNIPSNVIEELAEVFNCLPGDIMGWNSPNDTPPMSDKAKKFLDIYLNLNSDLQKVAETVLQTLKENS